MVQVVKLEEKFQLFREYWSPKIVGELNGSFVKLAKFKGPFVWHSHKEEDELFLVTKGMLRIELREKTLTINEGEFVIIPKGVEHRPVADEEVQVLLVEPTGTINTGEVRDALTHEKIDWI